MSRQEREEGHSQASQGGCGAERELVDEDRVRGERRDDAAKPLGDGLRLPQEVVPASLRLVPQSRDHSLARRSQERVDLRVCARGPYAGVAAGSCVCQATVEFMYSCDMTSARAQLRIGELSRRVGVSSVLLRAWERRYALMKPARSAGGFRLYPDADAARIRRMQTCLQQGLSAAEAARAVIEEPTPEIVETTNLADSAAEFQRALERYDEQARQTPLSTARSRT